MPQAQKKLLFVIPNLLRGGAEYQLFELCKGLKKNYSIDFSVLVFFRRTQESDDGYYEKIEALGVPVNVLFDLPPGKMELIKAINQFLTVHKPDIVQSFLEANKHLLLLSLTKTFRLYFGIRIFMNLSSFDRILFGLLQWRVRAFVGNSKICADHFVRQFKAPTSKSLCIYNGIDISRFQINEEPSSIRHDLNLPQKARCFVTVSNMHFPYKGHFDLLNAWKIHAPLHPDDHLVLIGEGKLRPQLEAIVHKSNLGSSVSFLGRRQDVPRVLQACDIYISPSHIEGFSNSIAEAILCGLPVIATDAGGARELVNSPDRGVVIPIKDVEALVKALALPLAPLATEAIKNMEKAIDLDRLSADYIKLYSLGCND